ncbi:transporter substrate-binding domain-containing protein [Streptosporangium sp. NBC_01755]|uniref:protein kinase domain-containing protein n=1 Tax=unclassified Streptosporangium TaxID=2632669 RepID=UPI002DD7D78A|nr:MULTISPECIES: transporter substrate-binding domain-containing protein [unclassified Streptosporangium]WSA24298.1 transporter substrate-binding domain-containing protein [Streptosporangium sp. NBC_01810]WSC97628.1 transporter substrate-binding domain-containing protein [Streptosporangium sp. NBC_01755]
MMSEIAPLEAGEPRQLGPFRVVGKIGEGGQGIVYLGINAAGERAAIKLLHVKFSGDAVARSRFAREARAAQRVASFCTAGVLDADLKGDTPYIASEYIEGRSLREVVETDGPLRGAALQRLAIGTATALTAIHHASIVHRDFKPDNVLIAADGPRVVDFGIARILDSTGTITSRAIGTPAYMAPEQISGSAVGPHSDVFAWGATIAFAATGETIFEGRSIAVVLNRILNHEVDLGSLPQPLRGVVTSALAKSPTARPSADQILLRMLGHPETVNASPAILTQGVKVATPDELRSRAQNRDQGRDEPQVRDQGRDQPQVRDRGHDEPQNRDQGRDQPQVRDQGRDQPRSRAQDQGVDDDATSLMRTPSHRTNVPGEPVLPSTGFRMGYSAQDQPFRPGQEGAGGTGGQGGRTGRSGQGERRETSDQGDLPSSHGPAENPPHPDHRPSERRPPSYGEYPSSPGYREHGYREHGYREHPSAPGYGDSPVSPEQAGEVPPPSWQVSATRVSEPKAPRRPRGRRWIAVGVAVLLIAGATVAAIRWWPRTVSQGEPAETARPSYTSVVDKAAKTGKLTIGVRGFLPGIALNNGGKWGGFEIDLALEIAKALGVPESGVTFRSTARSERPKLLADGDIDLVLATYSINDTDDVTFAGPYYLAHVDALVKDGSPIVTVKGLEGSRMCQPAASVSVAAIQGAVERLTLVPAETYSECVDKLRAGEIDAIPGDDLLLAGFGNRENIRYKLLGLKLTDERYAVALKKGDGRACEAVRGAIAALYQDGTVRRLLDKHFSRVEFPGRENHLPAMAACS